MSESFVPDAQIAVVVPAPEPHMTGLVAFVDACARSTGTGIDFAFGGCLQGDYPWKRPCIGVDRPLVTWLGGATGRR